MLTTLLLLACGTVSNAPFAEDADFTDAMPSADATTLELDDAAQTARSSDAGPVLYQYTVVYGSGVNQYLLALLAYPDAVRALPPSVREEDSRGWGPFEEDGVSIYAAVTRSGSSRFDWYFTANDQTILAGSHYAGETVRDGDGAFVWDLTSYAGVTGAPATGTLTCDYDNRAGVDLVVSVDDFSEDGGEVYSWDTAYTRVNDAGDFQFRTLSDTDEDGLEEDLTIRTRWVVGGGGRGDAVVTGGSLGDFAVRWTQCWDASRTLVYQWDDAGLTQAYGDVGDCPHTDFAEVDRI